MKRDKYWFKQIRRIYDEKTGKLVVDYVANGKAIDRELRRKTTNTSVKKAV